MLTRKIKNLFKDFATEEQGSVVVIVCLVATIVFIMASGLAIDLTRGEMAQSRMTSALDAAALAVEYNISQQPTSQQDTWAQTNAQSTALRYFNANYPNALNNHYLGTSSITPVATPNPDWHTVLVTANTTQQTTFMQGIGLKNIKVGSYSEATINGGSSDLELALILDNSDSMSPYMSSLITTLTASNGFIDTIFNGSFSNVYVSLIPYTDAVKLPAQSYVNNWHGIGGNGESLAFSPLSDFSGCMVNRKNAYLATDTAPWSGGNSATGFPRYLGPFDVNNKVSIIGYKASNGTRGLGTPPNATFNYTTSQIVNNNLDPTNATLSNMASMSLGTQPIHNGVRLGLNSDSILNTFGSRFPAEINYMHCNSNTDGAWTWNSWNPNCAASGVLNRSDMIRVDFGAQYISSFSNVYIDQLYYDFADQIFGCVHMANNVTYAFTHPYGCQEFGMLKIFDKGYTQLTPTVAQVYNGSNYNTSTGQINGVDAPSPNYITITLTSQGNKPFRYLEFTALDDGDRRKVFSATSTPYNNWSDNSDYGVRGFDYKPLCSPLLDAQFFMTSSASIKSQINSMQAAGPTRNDVGLAWGWFALSPKWRGTIVPGNNTMPKDYGASGNNKIAVIMTQGTNVDSTYDTNFSSICTAMKNSGVTVFTVAYNATPAVQTLLRNCATDPNNDFFTATTAAGLATAFSSISTNISSKYTLRIDK